MMLAFLAAPAGGSVLSTPDFWVAVSFFAFLAFLAYLGVPGIIAKALDGRAEGIRKELDSARRMREDAQALLTDYQRKTADAEKEAHAIVEQAKREGQALKAEAERKAAEMIERRVRVAEEKIARAERQALSEVRTAAVDAAISASRKILTTKASGDIGQKLVDESIQELRTKLN